MLGMMFLNESYVHVTAYCVFVCIEDQIARLPCTNYFQRSFSKSLGRYSLSLYIYTYFLGIWEPSASEIVVEVPHIDDLCLADIYDYQMCVCVIDNYNYYMYVRVIHIL